jgi:hypothetical protein
VIYSRRISFKLLRQGWKWTRFQDRSSHGEIQGGYPAALYDPRRTDRAVALDFEVHHDLRRGTDTGVDIAGTPMLRDPLLNQRRVCAET